MMRKLKLFLMTGLLLAALAGCVYTHPTTGHTYFFSHEYNNFAVEESLTISPSNYVGFCFLPLKEKDEQGEVTQSCPTPSNPMDCSLQGSSFHGIFQARVLEWGAIAFKFA